MSFSGNQYPNYADKVITTRGDIVRGSTTGDRERLGIGSSNQILQSNGTQLSWQTIAFPDSVLTTQGDILYENGSGLQRLGYSTAGKFLTTNGASQNVTWTAQTLGLEVAASDETTALTVANDLVTFRMPYAMTLNAGNAGIRASLTGAGSTSGVTTIDVNQGGVSLLSTKITIDYGEWSSTTAATPPVLSTTALTDDSQITVDVDGLTGGANETGLKICLIGVLT